MCRDVMRGGSTRQEWFIRASHAALRGRKDFCWLDLVSVGFLRNEIVRLLSWSRIHGVARK